MFHFHNLFVVVLALTSFSVKTMAQSANPEISFEMKRVESSQTLQREWTDVEAFRGKSQNLEFLDDPKAPAVGDGVSARALGPVEPLQMNENLGNVDRPSSAVKKTTDIVAPIRSDIANRQDRDRYLGNYKKALLEEIKRSMREADMRQSNLHEN